MPTTTPALTANCRRRALTCALALACFAFVAACGWTATVSNEATSASSPATAADSDSESNTTGTSRATGSTRRSRTDTTERSTGTTGRRGGASGDWEPTSGNEETCAALLLVTKRLNSFEDLESTADRAVAFDKLQNEFQTLADIATDEIKPAIDTLNAPLQRSSSIDTLESGDRVENANASKRLSEWSEANCGFDPMAVDTAPKFEPGEG